MDENGLFIKFLAKRIADEWAGGDEGCIEHFEGMSGVDAALLGIETYARMLCLGRELADTFHAKLVELAS